MQGRHENHYAPQIISSGCSICLPLNINFIGKHEQMLKLGLLGTFLIQKNSHASSGSQKKSRNLEARLTIPWTNSLHIQCWCESCKGKQNLNLLTLLYSFLITPFQWGGLASGVHKAVFFHLSDGQKSLAHNSQTFPSQIPMLQSFRNAEAVTAYSLITKLHRNAFFPCKYSLPLSASTFNINFIQHIAGANQHLGHKSYWNKVPGI